LGPWCELVLCCELKFRRATNHHLARESAITTPMPRTKMLPTEADLVSQVAIERLCRLVHMMSMLKIANMTDRQIPKR
ncbi:MAG: hypothetical protein KBG15_06155, partial [Kofleriaceae bacterium]|nr:hypothetical protein [Kofleriaceae bacterium]